MYPKQEIRRLNCVRGIAVMIVILSHFSNESGLWGGLLGQGAGQLGVMLFFLLSAFLMAHLYFDLSPTKQNLQKFAVARTARVIPLFLFLIMLSYAAYQILPLNAQAYFYNIPDARSLISHVLLLSGTSVLWSIPPEIYFYAVFVCLWISKKIIGNVAVLIPAALLIFSIIIPPQKVVETSLFGIYVKLSMLQVYPYFCAGFLLGWLYNHWAAPQWLPNHIFIIALLVIPLLYPNVLMNLTGISNGLWTDPRLLIVLTIIFFITVFLVPERNILLENPVGDFVGKISYSVYLLHYPILLGLKSFGVIQYPFGLLAFIGITFLVSALSFSYFEVPARNWIKARIGS